MARSSASDARERKKVLDRDFIVSVLESSATRRDAKGYLRRYGPQPESSTPDSGLRPATLLSADRAKPVIGQRRLSDPSKFGAMPCHIAIVKLHATSSIHETVCEGVAKTLTQLRALGLLSVVVIDDDPDASRFGLLKQAYRVSRLIDGFGSPKSRVLETTFERLIGGGIGILQNCPIASLLAKDVVPVVVPISLRQDISKLEVADSNDAVVALTRHLSSSPHRTSDAATAHKEPPAQPEIMVERIIILDPGGGIPMVNGPGSCHRFINLRQEYARIKSELAMPGDDLGGECPGAEHPISVSVPASRLDHVRNLQLSRDTLDLLPSSSSALITTPLAAANMLDSGDESSPQTKNGSLVKTRMRQNPLIHNLLTDKLVYSSSLPLERIYGGGGIHEAIARRPSMPTLVKRGMPLTIYPDPRNISWSSPWMGQTRPRLAEPFIDLERLIYLIEDSFGRKLDVGHYLNRVNENLAGVIVAGEYEGAAILTWERPPGAHHGLAERTVPYLDKFAVLKSRQGSGGVADIIFNAMVRDCFPNGVCWRSRQDNPVNKWYFERSVGALKLGGTHWTMFWTRPDIFSDRAVLLKDYESVCRSVQPSWHDTEAVAD